MRKYLSAIKGSRLVPAAFALSVVHILLCLEQFAARGPYQNDLSLDRRRERVFSA